MFQTTVIDAIRRTIHIPCTNVSTWHLYDGSLRFQCVDANRNDIHSSEFIVHVLHQI